MRLHGALFKNQHLLISLIFQKKLPPELAPSQRSVGCREFFGLVPSLAHDEYEVMCILTNFGACVKWLKGGEWRKARNCSRFRSNEHLTVKCLHSFSFTQFSALFNFESIGLQDEGYNRGVKIFVRICDNA